MFIRVSIYHMYLMFREMVPMYFPIYFCRELFLTYNDVVCVMHRKKRAYFTPKVPVVHRYLRGLFDLKLIPNTNQIQVQIRPRIDLWMFNAIILLLRYV